MPLNISQGRLTPHVRLGKVAAVLNAASGGVGAHVAEQMRALLAECGLDVTPRSLQPGAMARELKAPVTTKLNVLIVLAVDGALALSAQLCGCDGPLLAAVPGGR